MDGRDACGQLLVGPYTSNTFRKGKRDLRRIRCYVRHFDRRGLLDISVYSLRGAGEARALPLKKQFLYLISIDRNFVHSAHSFLQTMLVFTAKFVYSTSFIFH